MKLFFDTEFTGLHPATTLISLGCVTENDCTFYAEFNDYDESQINNWLTNHVVHQLEFADVEQHLPTLNSHHARLKGSRSQVASAFSEWALQFAPVELWADYPAYDWVLLCDLLGGALNLPDTIAGNALDVATLFSVAGLDTNTDRAVFAEQPQRSLHHALHDAFLAKACYYKLMNQIFALRSPR
jgi:hypothetical protein